MEQKRKTCRGALYEKKQSSGFEEDNQKTVSITNTGKEITYGVPQDLNPALDMAKHHGMTLVLCVILTVFTKCNDSQKDNSPTQQPPTAASTGQSSAGSDQSIASSIDPNPGTSDPASTMPTKPALISTPTIKPAVSPTDPNKNATSQSPAATAGRNHSTPGEPTGCGTYDITKIPLELK
ncbi:hypothetical protein GJAV_G00082070 [Gymnothorax javanicus]|nr:hypothetical protein GJAV_G00082070 [Gymnothorax javanicus]